MHLTVSQSDKRNEHECQGRREERFTGKVEAAAEATPDTWKQGFPPGYTDAELF